MNPATGAYGGRGPGPPAKNISGKTSLVESMLYITGVTDRLGKPADGNTVCDYDFWSFRYFQQRSAPTLSPSLEAHTSTPTSAA